MRTEQKPSVKSAVEESSLNGERSQVVSYHLPPVVVQKRLAQPRRGHYLHEPHTVLGVLHLLVEVSAA